MDYLNNELDSELVIGLVSAVGTENQHVIDLLKARLSEAGYRVEIVKVSSDVIALLVNVTPHGDDKYQRISSLMHAGNQARSIEGANDGVLANGVASIIFSRREKDRNGIPLPQPKTAFIVDSLKRPEEIAQLRLIYPSGFVSIGIHADEQRRTKHMLHDRLFRRICGSKSRLELSSGSTEGCRPIRLRHRIAPFDRGRCDGKAKAMVVVSSRLEAVRWQLAINKYIKDKGYPLTTVVAFTEAGSGSVQEKEKAYLSAIISKVNDLFKGELTDNDKLVYVNNVIMGKLLESQTLIQQATNNSKEQFANSPDLKTELMNAIIDALEAHTTMSTQALGSEVIRDGLRDILLGPAKLYETLRKQVENKVTGA